MRAHLDLRDRAKLALELLGAGAAPVLGQVGDGAELADARRVPERYRPFHGSAREPHAGGSGGSDTSGFVVGVGVVGVTLL